MNQIEIDAIIAAAETECGLAMESFDKTACAAADAAGDYVECGRLHARRHAAQDALSRAYSLVPDARRARIDRNIRAINAAQAASWHDDHRV